MADKADVQSPGEDGRRRYGRAALAAAMTVAVLVSLVVAIGGFTWGLPGETHIQSYHPDEQNITYSLRNMEPRKLDFNPRFFGNPTFYTYQVGALALGAALAGILPLDTSEQYWLLHPESVRRFYVLGRGLSLLYAVLSAVLVYKLAKRISGGAVGGLLAAAIFVSLPVSAVHCHYMTVNASAVFWSLAALAFALKIQDAPSWRNYAAAGVCAGLAISTKLNNIFLPLGIVAAHMTASGEKAGLKRLADGKLWAGAGLCAAAFFAGSPYYLLSLESVRANPHSQMNMTALLDFTTPIPVVLRDFWNHLSTACGWAFGIVFVAALPAAVLAGPRRKLAPIAAVAAPFLVVAVKSGSWAFPSRMWPLLAMFAVCVAAVTARRMNAAGARLVFAALLAGFLSTAICNVAYCLLMRGEHVRVTSSRFIEDCVPEGSSIIVLDTPYYDDPDIIYENALHGDFVKGKRYKIVNLKGDLDALAGAEADLLVVPHRLDEVVQRTKGVQLADYAEENGFRSSLRIEKQFSVFGWKIRNWVPADMVQNYPVTVFSRQTAFFTSQFDGQSGLRGADR